MNEGLPKNSQETPADMSHEEMPETSQLSVEASPESVIDFSEEQIHNAEEELNIDSEYKKKIEVISQAAKRLSGERREGIIKSLIEQVGPPSDLGNVHVWDSLRSSLGDNAREELEKVIDTVNGEDGSRSILANITNLIDGNLSRERKTGYDYRAGSWVEATEARPSLVLLELINERGDELSDGELDEVEDALHVLSMHALERYFSTQNVQELESIISLQEKLVTKNEEFNPQRSGFFELRTSLENASAAIELDFKSKPNYLYAYPQYSDRAVELERLESSLHAIEAIKFLQYKDIDLEDK